MVLAQFFYIPVLAIENDHLYILALPNFPIKLVALKLHVQFHKLPLNYTVVSEALIYNQSTTHHILTETSIILLHW